MPVSKQVIVIAKCDYPECDEIEDEATKLHEVDIWIYKAGKGRKPAPVRVDLCDDHAAEEVSRFSRYQRVGDADAATYPEVRK